MVVYTNSVTRRLEGIARRQFKREIHVIACNNNACGKYFISGENGQPCYRWIGLGWSGSEARTSLDHRFSDPVNQ